MENKLTLTGTTFVLIETDAEMAKMQRNGPELKWAIDEFYERSIRNRLKHNLLTKKEAALLEKLREELFQYTEGLL